MRFRPACVRVWPAAAPRPSWPRPPPRRNTNSCWRGDATSTHLACCDCLQRRLRRGEARPAGRRSRRQRAATQQTAGLQYCCNSFQRARHRLRKHTVSLAPATAEEGGGELPRLKLWRALMMIACLVFRDPLLGLRRQNGCTCRRSGPAAQPSGHPPCCDAERVQTAAWARRSAPCRHNQPAVLVYVCTCGGRRRSRDEPAAAAATGAGGARRRPAPN